jgi:hypothetical protein
MIDYRVYEEPKMPAVQAYIAARLRRQLLEDERNMRRLSRPFFTQGYRVEELTACYRRNASLSHDFYDVQIAKPRHRYILSLRRFYRFFFPYDPTKGEA